jgi:hypothetical protein
VKERTPHQSNWFFGFLITIPMHLLLLIISIYMALYNSISSKELEAFKTATAHSIKKHIPQSILSQPLNVGHQPGAGSLDVTEEVEFMSTDPTTRLLTPQELGIETVTTYNFFSQILLFIWPTLIMLSFKWGMVANNEISYVQCVIPALIIEAGYFLWAIKIGNYFWLPQKMIDDAIREESMILQNLNLHANADERLRRN